MSHEHAPTDGRGASTGDRAAVFDDRPRGEELDALFGVLADEQRRRVLAHLDERDGDVATFAELVDAVTDDAAANDEVSPEDASTDERERVATRLYHAHLPKLADLGLVEFDARSETVRYRGGRVVSDWLELARADRP